MLFRSEQSDQRRYVTLALRTTATLSNLRESMKLLSDKVGLILLILGLMHLFNLFLFSSMRTQPQNAYTATTFGQVTATRTTRGDLGSSRQLQLGIKLIF